MPGSPSPGGRKPGIRQIGQLVTRKGPEGSNPSPGAYFEEPSISLKALAGESRVEEVTTTMDDGLTANMTGQKQTMTTAADTSSIVGYSHLILLFHRKETRLLQVLVLTEQHHPL